MISYTINPAISSGTCTRDPEHFLLPSFNILDLIIRASFTDQSPEYSDTS
jgi:hypothetical protein